jgi:ribonuclease BN (tRNA processing enzyme)
MEFSVLGSGTCVPTAERGPSGAVLTLPPHLLFFDPGSGSLRQMARIGLDFRKIDFFCLSHFHPDHVADLVPFLFATNYTPDFTRTLPLHLIGPPGLRKYYDQLRGIYGHWIDAQTYALEILEIEEGAVSFLNWDMEVLPLAHSTASVGFRVNTAGRAMTYSGDTDYCENIVKLGRESDLLILECSFPEERRKKGHLTPLLAGRIAREASCKRLLLTHFYPLFQGHDILKECHKEFEGEIILAQDGMRIPI